MKKFGYFIVLLTFFSLFMLNACGRTSPDFCMYNTECPSGYSCINNKCIADKQCSSDQDCVSPQKCVDGVCLSSDTCMKDSDCKDGKKCINGRCEFVTVECRYNADCKDGYICEKNKCIKGEGCKTDKDCSENYRCLNNICKENECSLTKACPNGYKCVDNQCVLDVIDCKADFDCPDDNICKDGKCVVGCRCKSDQQCSSDEFCYDCKCYKKNQCFGKGCQIDAQCKEGYFCDLNLCSCKPKSEDCFNDCDCDFKSYCENGKCINDSLRFNMCCDSPYCEEGQFCVNKDGSTSICKQKFCRTDCDCIGNGVCDLNKNICVNNGVENICCGDYICPPKEKCVNPDGSYSMCPGECRTQSDCPLGYDCIQGKCIFVYECRENKDCPQGYQCDMYKCKPLYECLTNEDCPKNFYCESNVCKPKLLCKNDCDCDYSMGCVDGGCQYVNRINMCCNNPQCKQGDFCINKDGSSGTCGGVFCKTDCDCSFLEGCLNGSCVATDRLNMCCTNPLCIQGSDCINPDGSKGICKPKYCKTDCDCENGMGCVVFFTGQMTCQIVNRFN